MVRGLVTRQETHTAKVFASSKCSRQIADISITSARTAFKKERRGVPSINQEPQKREQQSVRRHDTSVM